MKRHPDLHGRGGLLIGLIGSGIGGSFSPQLHETEARELGLQLHYRLLDGKVRAFGAADLPRLLDAMALLGFAGSNVTHPFKEAIVSALASLSDAAAEIGAVNTIVRHPNGGWVGHNTDWMGFTESFRRGLPDAAIGRVMLLGAGGAGAAVGYGMLRHGVEELLILDRDRAKAKDLATRLAGLFGANRARAVDTPDTVIGGSDGLVNATPMGMVGEPGSPLDPDLLNPGLWVADILYVPRETELLRAARALGCRTMNGGGMVVFQAAEAFRLFTGISPDGERMLRHFHAGAAAAD